MERLMHGLWLWQRKWASTSLANWKRMYTKGETSDAMRLRAVTSWKRSQLITHAARDQGGDGLCPGCLSRMTWKGNAALRKSAWIRLYKAVCTVNITVSWVWVLFTPLKGRNGGGNLNVCQIEITVKELEELINSFLSTWHWEVQSSHSVSSADCSY